MSNKGFTSFHIAAEIKDTRILATILEASKPDSLKAKTVNGNVPIMGAWSAGNFDNVNLLLEYGSNLWELNKQSLNWFDYIALTGNTELFKWVFDEWKKNVTIPEVQGQNLWVHVAWLGGHYNIP